jgi:hypothetical protein
VLSEAFAGTTNVDSSLRLKPQDALAPFDQIGVSDVIAGGPDSNGSTSAAYSAQPIDARNASDAAAPAYCWNAQIPSGSASSKQWNYAVCPTFAAMASAKCFFPHRADRVTLAGTRAVPDEECHRNHSERSPASGSVRPLGSVRSCDAISQRQTDCA